MITKNAFGDKNFTITYKGITVFAAHVVLDNELHVKAYGEHTLELDEVLAFKEWLDEVYHTPVNQEQL